LPGLPVSANSGQPTEHRSVSRMPTLPPTAEASAGTPRRAGQMAARACAAASSGRGRGRTTSTAWPAQRCGI